MATHLLILGEREAIAWVLKEQRMAFTANRASGATAAIKPGDELFLYQTRSAFHNPTRHRGRVIGRATVTSVVRPLKNPVLLVARQFSSAFEFKLNELAPPHSGPELAALVPRLVSFPNKKGWATALRRPFLTLAPADARLLRRSLAAAVVEDKQAAIAPMSPSPGPGADAASRR